MQRYSHNDKLLFTADQLSLAFSGLMLPDTIVAALESLDQELLSAPLEFPDAWSASRLSQAAQTPTRTRQPVRTAANKLEMRGGSLRARS